MTKNRRMGYILGFMWMVVGLVQLMTGREEVGIFGVIVGIQFIALSEMEEKE